MKPEASIIIVNYNTAQLVLQCVESVIRLTEDLDYEVIVVDNNSGDGIDQLLGERFAGRVKCLMLRENVGFGQANNAGFAQAQGDFILCLNPDTQLLNNAVKELASFLKTNAQAGACGGNVFGPDMKPAFSFYRILPGLRWELFELTALKLPILFFGRSVLFNHTGKPLSVGYVTGADLMIRRELWEKTGGFAKEFFMYYEETDLCARIKRLGYKIYSVPTAEIVHFEGASFRADGTVSQRKYDEIARSRRIYMQRNLPAWKTKLCDCLYCLYINLFHILFRLKRDPHYKVYQAKISARKRLAKKD